MLHEAIFLATCNALMMTEKHCKLQRGCHRFAIFSQLNTSVFSLSLSFFSLLTTAAILKSPAREGRALIGSSCQNYIASCRGDVTDTQATCVASLRKVEDSSTSIATRNATIAVAKWAVIRQIFLATCDATFVALQVARKIASCNMAFTRKCTQTRKYFNFTEFFLSCFPCHFCQYDMVYIVPEKCLKFSYLLLEEVTTVVESYDAAKLLRNFRNLHIELCQLSLFSCSC